MVYRMYVVQFTDGTQVRFWCEQWASFNTAHFELEKHNRRLCKAEKIVLVMEDNAFLQINDP